MSRVVQGEGQEATVIAWLWARTVKCPNPACGATMPLVRSFALSTKPGKKAWVEPVVDRAAKTVAFTVRSGNGLAPEGTVGRKGARCVVCGSAVPFEHIRSEGRAGRMASQLMAIVAEGTRGRVYLAPSAEHESIARQARPAWEPDTELPGEALGFRVQNYGLTRHTDLYSRRQLASLAAFSGLVQEATELVANDARLAGYGRDEAKCYADATATYLAFAVDRLVDFGNSLCAWNPGNEKVMHLFGRQTVPMVWDYAESNVMAAVVGGWLTAIPHIASCIETLPPATRPGVVSQADAVSDGTCLPEHFAISTDPPYYDNVPYADLSDLFYVWLRRSLGRTHPALLSTIATPKSQELIADPFRLGGPAKAREAFERGMAGVFASLCAKADPAIPVTLYYAFKQSETEEGIEGDVASGSSGWESMLSGLIRAGFQITATWPMRTEQTYRVRNLGRNALASSIVLACRPRPDDAPMTTRRDFVAALRRDMPDALLLMMRDNVAPVDLAQASIGPGMAVYSRYSKVLEPDGSRLTVRAALQAINEELDRLLASDETAMDVETRFCIAWFSQYGFREAPFDQATVMARAKGAAIDGLRSAGVLEAHAGKARLLTREEMDPGWNPATDTRLTLWEAAQHLVRALNTGGGEEEAAQLAARLGGLAEEAKSLAYRLYTVCERKGWSQDAQAYNNLVVAWPRIRERAAEVSAAAASARYVTPELDMNA